MDLRKYILIGVIGGLGIAGPVHAATISLGNTVPEVDDGVQNLMFSTGSADNTAVQYITSNYLQSDHPQSITLGQSFTTGSYPDGYTLSSVSVRQIGWGPTDWDYTGGNVTLRIFDLNGAGGAVGTGVWKASELVAETAFASGDAGGFSSGAVPGDPLWLTISLDAPPELAPDTLYGFAISTDGTRSGNDGFFMELDGTAADSYAGGFAFSVPSGSSDLWDGNNGQPSDRAFVATMQAAQPPVLQLGLQSGAISIAASNAHPGKWYGLQFSDSLPAAAWRPVTDPLLAVDSTVSFAGLSTAFGTNRFYRLCDVSRFSASVESRGLSSLRPMGDAADSNYTAAEFIASGGQLGNAFLRYQPLGGSGWNEVDTSALTGVASFREQTDTTTNGTRHAAHYEITASLSGTMVLESVMDVGQDHVEWTLNLTNASAQTVTVGDLAVPLPMNTDYQSPSTSVFKHSFISGNNSWMFWMRPDGIGPYLTMMTDPNTKLEYWDGPGARGQAYTYRAYIHSSVAAQEAVALGSEWRQANTHLTLEPGASKSYGFKFRWADGFNGVRQMLVAEGQIDVHVVPGMTVPDNLTARIALHTTQSVDSVEAEFPADTAIEFLGINGDYTIYQVEFTHLGENLLTVNYGGGRQMVLEFFVTEPLETLIRKRAQFLVDHQINNAAKWYDGLYPEWNMKTQTLVTPDNYDEIPPVYQYEVAADDAGLARPAFLALKNVVLPDQAQVDSLDKYIQDFVWGGLQRTTDETYSYGIYGVRDWYVNRYSADSGIWGRLHLWRTYDYPHITTMYESMYRIAKNNPQITTVLSADEYLERAFGTAMAMFSIPYSVWPDDLWIPYHTGYMNESVIPGLIEDLDAEGMSAEAAALRAEWEQKVNYFVFTASDLFASEMTFDSTGFESQQAIARYALENAATLDPENPAAYAQSAAQFMDKVTMANVTVRGWLEPAYYHYGSDYRGNAGDNYTLSYMSQLGGWGLLDYALHFSTNATPYLRLGYGSYLSSWALMNTGTAESNYGYWYPGEANDGACGGGFEPSPYNDNWMELPIRRGAWFYGAEEDLGFCGAIRAAATILADDPIFGRYCYGGDWQLMNQVIAVTPKDGVRRRFHAMLDSGQVHLELENDNFAVGQSITLSEDLSEIAFVVDPANRRPTMFCLIFCLCSGILQGQRTLRNIDERRSAVGGKRFAESAGERRRFAGKLLNFPAIMICGNKASLPVSAAAAAVARCRNDWAE